MKLRLIIFLLISFSILTAVSLSGIDPSYYDYNARISAMGGAGTALKGYTTSVNLVNPAALTEINDQMLLQAVNSKYFQIISYNFLGISKRKNSGVYSFALDFSGDDVFSEYEMICSAAFKGNDLLPEKKFFNKLDIGANLKLLGASYGNNSDGAYYDENGLNHQVTGDAFGYAIDLGMQYELDENNSLGLFNRNIINDVFYNSSNQCSTALGAYSESKPVALTLGYCYNQKHATICMDYKMKLYEDSEDMLKTGFEILLFGNRLAVRSGWSTQIFSLENNQFNMGSGINFNYAKRKFTIDIAFRIFSGWEDHNNLLISLTAEL